MADLIPILAWAADYYPTRTSSPPELRHLGAADICALFAQCPSKRAHLALVDQEPIRRRFSDPQCRAAAKTAWERYATQDPLAAPPSPVYQPLGALRRPPKPRSVSHTILDPEASRTPSQPRRCVICGSDRAHWGFGPPLVAKLIWSCRAHRDQVDPASELPEWMR